MGQDLDLLGDPIPANFGGRGRPEHIPTTENRNKVMLLLALEWADEKVAKAIGITRPTLRKHYLRELKARDEARARLEANMIAGMAAKALGGDVPAYREVRRIFDRADVASGEAYRPVNAPQTKTAKLGKKAERQAAADQVGGIFAPGPPPLRLVSP